MTSKKKELAADAGQLRCLIVATHYLPLVGGAQTVYDALACSKPGQFHVLTSMRDYATGEIVAEYDEFDRLAPYQISRIDRIRPDLNAGRSSLFAKVISTLHGWMINQRLLRQIKYICRNEEIDCIWVAASDAIMWLPPKLKHRTDKKVIVFAHGEEFSQIAHSKAAEKKRHLALKVADGAIGVSHYTTDLLIKKYGADSSKVFLSTNGVNSEKFSGVVSKNARDRLKIPVGPVVFSCGRLVARKGFDKLLAAWPGIREHVPEANLFIGGTGPIEARLKQEALNLQIEDSVHFLGEVDSEDIASYYGVASVFAMPNRTMPDGDTEGFGLVFLEASAMGTVSVAGRAGGTTDAVQDGKTGMLVDANNIKEIENAITTLLTDNALRERMSNAAQAFARTQDWGKKLSGILAFIAMDAAGNQEG